VIIRLTPDKEKLRNRKCVVEHPFGTIKRSDDGSYFLLKGIEKTTAEMALSLLAYNIKRAINMVGVEEIVRKMKEIRGDLSFIFVKYLEIWINPLKFTRLGWV